MSASSLHRTSSAVLPGFHGTVAHLTRAADTLLGWLQRDRDRRILQALDERLLRDIGVSRGEVEAEVAKPFWRG